MRLLHDEHHGTKACNDADSCAIVRNRVHRIYLAAPLHAQARSKVQTGLLSRLSSHPLGVIHHDVIKFFVLTKDTRGKPIIHYTTVYKVFARWADDGSL